MNTEKAAIYTIALVLQAAGIGLLLYYAGWQVTLGVFLFVWGYGISQQTALNQTKAGGRINGH